MNLTGVRAVRPVLLTPANYSHVEQSVLRLNLPSQPQLQLQKQQQQQQESAGVEGKCCIDAYHLHLQLANGFVHAVGWATGSK